jgi:hypothetical protein
MKRITLFVLPLFMGLNLYSQNLVVNPGFESWEKITKPAGWVHVESCLKDSAFVVSGKYSCQHSGGATSTNDLGQTIPVSPGTEYTLSLYFRTVLTSSGNGARIWCYWKNSGGTSITDPSTDAILRPSKYMKSDSWQQFSIKATAPASAVEFYLEVRTYPNSITYLDDIVFEESITTDNPEEKIRTLIIYPNPAHENLVINNIPHLQHIDILDLKGTIVMTSGFRGETTATIPLAGLHDGLYIIRIVTCDRVFVRKFILKAD